MAISKNYLINYINNLAKIKIGKLSHLDRQRVHLFDKIPKQGMTMKENTGKPFKKVPSRKDLMLIAKNNIEKLAQEEALVRQNLKNNLSGPRRLEKKNTQRLLVLVPRLETWEYFYNMVRSSSFDVDMMKHWADISSEKVKNAKMPKVQRQWLDEQAEAWTDISKILE